MINLAEKKAAEARQRGGCESCPYRPCGFADWSIEQYCCIVRYFIKRCRASNRLRREERV